MVEKCKTNDDDLKWMIYEKTISKLQ